MTNADSSNGKQEIPILNLIQQIKDKLLDPRTLDKESRQSCVEVLIGEGYNEPAIAKILERNERTIKRDLIEIRKRNALTPDLNLAKELIGELIQKARLHHGQLLRIGRTERASAGEKIAAEISGWRVFREMIQTLQTLGYLPLKEQAVTGEFFYHFSDDGQEMSLEELKQLVSHIEQSAREAGTFDAQTEARLKDLKAKIERFEVSVEATKLLMDVSKTIEKKEETNETEDSQ